jgi:hypothetical protein
MVMHELLRKYQTRLKIVANEENCHYLAGRKSLNETQNEHYLGLILEVSLNKLFVMLYLEQQGGRLLFPFALPASLLAPATASAVAVMASTRECYLLSYLLSLLTTPVVELKIKQKVNIKHDPNNVEENDQGHYLWSLNNKVVVSSAASAASLLLNIG